MFRFKNLEIRSILYYDPIRPDGAPLTLFRDTCVYVLIFRDTATSFVFNPHKYLTYIFFKKEQINLPSSLPSSFFLLEGSVVPENVFLYETATIPTFIVIVYLYKSCVNNPYVLVGLFYPWRMLHHQIIYITKCIQTKATFWKATHPRSPHHLDMNRGSSCNKEGADKFSFLGNWEIFTTMAHTDK